MLIPLMRASPNLYINPTQSCGCWAGTTEPKRPTFELRSRQLEAGIKQTPDASVLSSERDYPGWPAHGAAARPGCPATEISLLHSLSSDGEAEPAPRPNGRPEVDLLGWAGLPELLLCPPGAGPVPPRLHDGGRPSLEALLPGPGDGARGRLRVPAGQGTVSGRAGGHPALEWPLHPSKCG